MEERRARRGRLGCWSVAAVTGLAALLPLLFHQTWSLLHRSRSEARPSPTSRRPQRQPRVCMEAWVRLRSYRGCPVLAAAGGYRLGIYCSPAGWSNGALVFAGPFAGRAYLSEAPVPLGHWIHLAALAGGGHPGETAAARVLLAIGGSEVTAGKMFGQGDPMPLGYDPWADLAVAATASGKDRRCGRAAVCRSSATIDGEIGAWRLSRRWRTLEQVTAGRGTPLHLAALPPPEARPPAAARQLAGGITRRGWRIVAAGLLLAAAMVAAGIVLRPRGGGAAPGEHHLVRVGR